METGCALCGEPVTPPGHLSGPVCRLSCSRTWTGQARRQAGLRHEHESCEGRGTGEEDVDVRTRGSLEVVGFSFVFFFKGPAHLKLVLI